MGLLAFGLNVGIADAQDASQPAVTPVPASAASTQPYDWTGLYLGGHIGAGGGDSHWSAGPGNGGAFSLYRPLNFSNEGGSWFTGLQSGYNYVFPSRLLLSAEVDVSAPSYPKLPHGSDPYGLSIGGRAEFTSPRLGTVSYVETVQMSGTARARVGYAPGNWLFYATGGLAWTYDQQSLTQIHTGTTDTPYLLRLGWAAGAGVETPIAPHWTARAEYLYTDYGKTTTEFFGGAQPVTSDWQFHEIRLGLNYQFGGADAAPAEAPPAPALDFINIHGQTTVVWQGYHIFQSPYQGANSLRNEGEGRETSDVDLSVGARLWDGAEAWFFPGMDQGFGIGNTHGLAGYSSGEAYKIGSKYPYARIDRAFVRQTIDLGGAAQDVEADIFQFAGTTTADRVVLTAGKFAVGDLFDTNRYANNPKEDFQNWSIFNAGSFDSAADAWGFTYGAAAEWYEQNWALRGGIFDMSATPTGGGSHGADGYALDGSFRQFQLDAEIERRHLLWGQPGSVKVTGFLTRGDMGNFKDAVTRSQSAGIDANDALAAVRHYQSKPGASLNLGQQVSDSVGVFARAGWADGDVEPWDFSDIDQTVSGGVSLNGKRWGRPDDTIGVAGAVNFINKSHQEWLNAGGTGILVGDGQLPKYKPEKVIETYYSYAVIPAVHLTLDFQFVADPAYNAQRGPVAIWGGRAHAEF